MTIQEHRAKAFHALTKERDRYKEDKVRLDWLQSVALGASIDATLDDLIGKGWTDLRTAIDNKAKL